MNKDYSKIAYLLFDVDGVLSDGRITYSNTGDEIKSFHARDGMGLVLAKRAGLKVGIVTARESNIVFKRATELKLDDLFMNQKDKGLAFAELQEKHGLSADEFAYMGDDLIDLPILKKCGFSAAPADSDLFVKENVDLCLKRNGGEGAAREFVEYILEKQNKLADIRYSFLP